MIHTVSSSDSKKRLDLYVSEIEKKYTRSYIKTLIEQGKIKVNGKIVKAGYSIKAEDQVQIDDIEQKVVESVSENIPLDIIYEDDDIIIINKPKGMVVHPANGNYTGTLVNALLYSHIGKLSSINGVIRPGIVHRIDKDTTGILVVAKNDNAHKKLSDQFKVHSIKREYIALVKGIIKEDSIIINKPIGRSDKDRKKMSTKSKKTRNAITHINVLERFYISNVTLVKATLETGRTHQIRVHMTSIAHPLVGDEVYSKNADNFKVKGQMLHAMTLGFIHPTTGKYVEFSSPLTGDFSNLIDTLRKKEK
ncbi:MAG: RluA family pseudouridine synthase [Clostridia bacterium]|nr:RluA family pseudouridine synthase [Clostridia bacterium]